MKRSLQFAIVSALFLLILNGCRDDDDLNPCDLSLVTVEGKNQSAGPYQELEIPPRVKVINRLLQNIEGIRVEFEVISGGGSILVDEGYTDVEGNVHTYWILGGSGTQIMEASLKLEDGSHVEGSPRQFVATFSSTPCDTAVDADGNVYPAVQIGEQCWLAENLRTTRYRNGDPIPHLEIDSLWANTEGPAYTRYNNNEDLPEIYGMLYNWNVVKDSRGVCPEGWRIAKDSDFNQLADYLGGSLEAGGKMKIAGLDYWDNPNTGATNSSGFSGVGGGMRHINGDSYDFGRMGVHWTDSEATPSTAWVRYLYSDSHELIRQGKAKKSGASIRCVAF